MEDPRTVGRFYARQLLEEIYELERILNRDDSSFRSGSATRSIIYSALNLHDSTERFLRLLGR